VKIHRDIFIAVMGVTGSGKSSFIKLCCGADVKIGHDLQACELRILGQHVVSNLLLRNRSQSLTSPQARARSYRILGDSMIRLPSTSLTHQGLMIRTAVTPTYFLLLPIGSKYPTSTMFS
jgi:ABC-type cobalamin/Fe3+-siderophores transport system ATPase subunit